MRNLNHKGRGEKYYVWNIIYIGRNELLSLCYSIFGLSQKKYRIDVDIIVNGASQSLRTPFTFITNTNSKLFNQMEKKKITNNNQTYANMNQKTNSNLCMNLKSDAKVG